MGSFQPLAALDVEVRYAGQSGRNAVSASNQQVTAR